LGPNQASTATNLLPPSLSDPSLNFHLTKRNGRKIGDVVESKSNKLKKSEHSPLLLDIETFEFPK